MKPRILKKLSKKVKELAGDKFGEPWIDHEEPFPAEFCESKYSSSTMTNIWCVGGEFDSYLGDCSDFFTLFNVACDYVYWEFGEPTLGQMTDELGVVIDEVPSWPVYKKRLTGQHVIKKLKQAIGEGRLK